MPLTYSLENLLLDDPELDHESLLGPVVRMRWFSNLLRLAVIEEIDRLHAAAGEYTEYDAEIRRLRRSSMAPDAGRYYPVEGKSNRIFKNLQPEQAAQIVDHWRTRQPIPAHEEDPDANLNYDECSDEEHDDDEAEYSAEPEASTGEWCNSFPIPHSTFPITSAPLIDRSETSVAFDDRPDAGFPNGRHPDAGDPDDQFPDNAHSDDDDEGGYSDEPARHGQPQAWEPLIESEAKHKTPHQASFPIRHSAFPITSHPLANSLADRSPIGNSRIAHFLMVAAITVITVALALAAIWQIKSNTDQPQPIEFSSPTVPKGTGQIPTKQAKSRLKANQNADLSAGLGSTSSPQAHSTRCARSGRAEQAETWTRSWNAIGH